ncbi:hypothetical protein F441_02286 [Phytophthora nicotianae CJ01A1]|uniref:Uncharacterized protein n=6 Tax=Phytophthora nicotianae TaxID=4792 RepID=W2QQX0_PHYN3|nr:hypothetical protein PPTG_22031 [Phytophthora nicotianae INRA-310]ETI54959.1 hypothetical protein F443_02315 [Phytophthora nicotianae P1569]ETK94795.1 hypothetical protein L915_02214 [Phytophthora nicotianae]ETO83713.1 hypothetical protein F444_02310 [Phytophthora nicotianae P1976]ETP24772.1 hypothetical protein F441_02286 [Phytophthora nicotianae CJ01A1]ETP52755.1 hypothetical protein F442_02279 [Phytophthora nicotianae P10297]
MEEWLRAAGGCPTSIGSLTGMANGGTWAEDGKKDGIALHESGVVTTNGYQHGPC